MDNQKTRTDAVTATISGLITAVKPAKDGKGAYAALRTRNGGSMWAAVKTGSDELRTISEYGKSLDEAKAKRSAIPKPLFMTATGTLAVRDPGTAEYILLSSSHELTGEMPKTEDHITITGSVWKVRETATDGEISVGVEADLKTGKIPLMVRITRKACPEAYDDLISDSRHKRLSVDGAIRCDAYTNGQVAVNVMKINATKAYALNPNKTKNEIRNKRKNI